MKSRLTTIAALVAGFIQAGVLQAGNLRIGGVIEADTAVYAHSVTGAQAAVIIATSNGLLQANANIANTSNAVVTLDAKLVATSNVLMTAIGTGGSTTNYTDFAGVVTGSQSNLIATAWQNPASATNWTWTSDGHEITLTGYNFISMDVVIPDMLDGLPVTTIQYGVFSFGGEGEGTAVQSITGGLNINTVMDGAFYDCNNLHSVNIYGLTTIGTSAFGHCDSLTNIIVKNVSIIGVAAFRGCVSLRSVIFSLNAPIENAAIFADITANQVTNYVTNPTATGWGATFGGMPVVRMGIEAKDATIGTVIKLSTNYSKTGSETAGSVYWDSDEHSLALMTDITGTSLTWGGEISTYSRNNESFVLSNGAPVYIVSGGAGPTKRVGLASCMDSAKDGFFGLVTVDAGLAVNGFGMITSFGRVKGLNTSVWNEGDALYLCNGALTNGIPTTTNDIWQVGYVEYKHAVNGVIFVTPTKNGFAKSWQLSDRPTFAETTNIVAGASSANFIVRLTTNKLTNFTFTPTNATYFGDCSGSSLAANGVISVLAGNVNEYVLAWGCTNTIFTTIEGTYVNYEFYCREADTGDQQFKLEIYRRDVATDTMSEWGDGGPTFTVPTTGSPTLVSGSVYVPSIATNAFRIWARLKRVGGTATNLRNLFIGSGVGTPTHFSMVVPASVPIDAHNSDVNAHPSIIKPLSWTPIETVASASVATVNVTTAKSIYNVTASSVLTLTNNLSTIAFNCTTNIEWEIWVTMLSTNMVFDPRMEWQNGTPEFTCTGLYKFACSSPCGSRIFARQTYPSVYPWVSTVGMPAGGSLNIGAATNASINVAPNMWSPNRGYLFQIKFIASAGTNFTYTLSERFGSVKATIGPITAANTLFKFADIHAATYDPWVTSTFTTGAAPYTIEKIVSQGNAVNQGMYIRSKILNEVETSYYNAGGRDFK